MDSEIKTTDLMVSEQQMNSESGTTGPITVKQLPVIVEQLHSVKAEAEKKVQDALSLVCTQETLQVVKKRRTELNNEFNDLESQRIAAKNAIMAPYKKFEAVYRECVTDIYRTADEQLACRIAEIEDDQKQKKASQVVGYFNELQRANPELEWVTFEDVGLSITLSASLKSLKSAVKKYMDGVAKDIECIRGMANGFEVLAEYKQVRDLAVAVSNVHKREMRIAAERNAAACRAEQSAKAAEAVAAVQEIVAEDAALQPPAAIAVEDPDPVVDDRKYSATFKVTDTLDRLRALKAWLEQEGYQYECN